MNRRTSFRGSASPASFKRRAPTCRHRRSFGSSSFVPPFVVSPEIEDALKRRSRPPIVALESTIISHGMPYPQNYQTARDVENVVREQGAVPATIAILDGNVHIGLTDKDLKLLAQEGPKGNVRKCSRRDLSYVTAQKLHGATTVAGTLCIASMFEDIDVFVTGALVKI